MLKKDKMLIWKILYPTIVIFGCYLIAALGIYDPQDLTLNAT